MKNLRMTPRLTTLIAAPIFASLAACGSDTSNTAPTQAFLGAMKGAIGSVTGGKGQTASQGTTQAGLDALIAQALAATDGQVMILGIESSNVTLAIAPVTTNGAVVTWKTPDRRSFAFKRGVLAGTRGFGEDLMSIHADPSISLITTRRTGRVPRVNHYLSGLGYSSTLSLDCVISGGASERMIVGQINTVTTHLTETCQRDGLVVENQYWVDARGKILRSRQWVSQGLGYIVTQQLRP
ncbi:YjbF family lipoprotein [Aliiroseovarius sp.]|uniref:YjbF family lipoprotein n=1 Tax=Aliiroseovarius sp. TaxID=1872442 RepID=UPI003BA8DD2B